MSRTRWFLRCCAVVAVASLAAAGCGVSATDAAGPERAVSVEAGRFQGVRGAELLGQAAQETTEVTTQKVAMDITIEGLPMVGTMSLSSRGQFDNEAERAQLSLDMGDVFTSFGTRAGLPDDAGTIETVVDGDVVYMRSALLRSLSGQSKPWLKIDASDLDTAGALAGGAQSDPGKFLEFLEGAGTVEELGTEAVRGVETTHVAATIELAKLIEDAPADQRQRLEDALASLGAAGDPFRSIPAEAWVDGNGRVRKFTMTLDLSQVMSGRDDGSLGDGSTGDDDGSAGGAADMGDASVAITVELYDFDQPVDITIPDPADVGELDPSALGPGGN